MVTKTKETVLVACDACDARVAAAVEGSYEEYVEPADFAVRFLLLKCPTCSGAILAEQDDEEARYSRGDIDRWGNTSRLYPEAQKRQLGTAVPEAIRTTFAEARACFEDGRAYTACAIMCRKVLEGVCNTHAAKGSNLSAKLKDLFERGELDKRLFEWITALRIVGNEAAHDVNVTVSKEDASDLLDLTEAVAEYLYTFKEKFETFQKRRSSRQKRNS